MKGEQVRQDIRAKLNEFHNAVNTRLGKPCKSLQPLSSFDRAEHIRELQHIFEELKDEWGAAHLEWKRTGALLLSLVKSGPT